MSSYRLELSIPDDNTDYMNAIDKARADMLLTENIDYIYPIAPVVYQKNSDDIKPLLERYANGNFSDAELHSLNESSHTQEEIIQWAKELLAKTD